MPKKRQGEELQVQIKGVKVTSLPKSKTQPKSQPKPKPDPQTVSGPYYDPELWRARIKRDTYPM
jgi:hypothetical protein